MTFSLSPTADCIRDNLGNRRLFDVNELGELLNCSPRHCYRLADSGRIPRPIKLGAIVRWNAKTGDPMTGILDWLEASCPSCRKEGRR